MYIIPIYSKNMYKRISNKKYQLIDFSFSYAKKDKIAISRLFWGL